MHGLPIFSSQAIILHRSRINCYIHSIHKNTDGTFHFFSFKFYLQLKKIFTKFHDFCSLLQISPKMFLLSTFYINIQLIIEHGRLQKNKILNIFQQKSVKETKSLLYNNVRKKISGTKLLYSYKNKVFLMEIPRFK